MSNGEIKNVYDLRPGDNLQSWNGFTCKLKCILKTKCLRPIKIVDLNGLKITPYHPVFTNKWEFPLYLAACKTISCDYVYNLVVDREHVVIINGIKCVTLGHGYNQEVVNHPYFGSERVLNDLKKMKGWNNGLIQIDYMLTIRDEKTGLINGIIQSDYEPKSFEIKSIKLIESF